MIFRHKYFRSNKYNAKTCHCRQNHTHRSMLEANYCNQLYILLKAKEIKSYEVEKRFSFDVAGVHITNYFADFYIENNDGTFAVHETKGMITDVYRIKKKLFAALYPDIEFIEVRR